MENGTALVKQMSAEAPNQSLQQFPVLDRENLTFFANMIEAADLVPQEKVNGQVMPKAVLKARVMAKIVGGAAHGFDAINSQLNMDIIQGRMGPNARGIGILIGRSGRYTTRIEYLNDEGCKLRVLERKSPDAEWVTKGFVEFTKEMAAKAELLTKNGSMYKKFGPDMYYARCITRVAKRFAPECLDTVPTVFRLAKQPEPAQAIAEPPTRQIEENSSPSTGEPYADPVYSYSDDDEMEGEFIPADDDQGAVTTAEVVEPDGEIIEAENDARFTLESLQADTNARLEEFDAAKRKTILKGRVVELLSLNQLEKLNEDISEAS